MKPTKVEESAISSPEKNNGSTIYKSNIKSQTTESVFETELTAIRMTHEYLYNYSKNTLCGPTACFLSDQSPPSLTSEAEKSKIARNAFNLLGKSNSV